MAIEVLPVVPEDFAIMRLFVDSKDGQLAGVAVLQLTIQCPWIQMKPSLQLQQEVFENDKSAHFMKAVDTSNNNTILSIAHWHYYPSGYIPSNLQYAGLKDMNNDDSYPKGLNVPLYKTVLGSMINERNVWTGDGPQWILTNIKTRKPMRRQGAAGALVKWGVDKAKEDKCPAYLEADPGGVSLYQKHGFVGVGYIKVDLNPHGIPEVYILKKIVANQ